MVAEDGSRMAASYKVPPKFDEARPFECWKIKLISGCGLLTLTKRNKHFLLP